MIEERMTQIERSMGNESNERLASLEKENKALKEYAKKVEDSVKNLLTAEKEKARQRVTRAVQTHDPHWVRITPQLMDRFTLGILGILRSFVHRFRNLCSNSGRKKAHIATFLVWLPKYRTA